VEVVDAGEEASEVVVFVGVVGTVVGSEDVVAAVVAIIRTRGTLCVAQKVDLVSMRCTTGS